VRFTNFVLDRYIIHHLSICEQSQIIVPGNSLNLPYIFLKVPVKELYSRFDNGNDWRVIQREKEGEYSAINRQASCMDCSFYIPFER